MSDTFMHNSMSGGKAKKSQECTYTFPFKLWKLLDECENGAIRWSDDGEYIVIDPAKFQKSQAVQKSFKSIQWTSFIRQLNLYGFHKFSPNNGSCSCQCHSNCSVVFYRHNVLRRGDWQSLASVSRSNKRKRNLLEMNLETSSEEKTVIESTFQAYDSDAKESHSKLWNMPVVPLSILPDSNFYGGISPEPSKHIVMDFDDEQFDYVNGLHAHTRINNLAVDPITMVPKNEKYCPFSSELSDATYNDTMLEDNKEYVEWDISCSRDDSKEPAEIHICIHVLNNEV